MISFSQFVSVITSSIVLIMIAAPTRWSSAQTLPITGRSEPDLAGFDQLLERFMSEHAVPGAAVAIAREGKIVYARGFGYSDVANKTPVQPGDLFRIASISKPFTSAAIMQLAERGKLKLDEPAFPLLHIPPLLVGGAKQDPRLNQITIRQLLHHTGGFDRDKSGDPMFKPGQIAKAAHTTAPADPHAIIAYVEGQPLDFDPGTREAYSNFGYCVLGRVVEAVSGMSYEQYVQTQVLKPLGISRMRIGHSLETCRAPGEVHYYERDNPKVRSVFPGRGELPVQYGGWNLEAMDSHGGWIASAPELVRFGSVLDDADHCPILRRDSIEMLHERPKITGYDADGKPKDSYYGLGWAVRPVGNDRRNMWHNGLLDGSSTLLVRRSDGLVWAVLFNMGYDEKKEYLGKLIDPLMHQAADQVKHWPAGWDFAESDRGN